MDLSFGDGGVVITDLHEGSNFSSAVIEQLDGKVISGGFSFVNSTEENALIRYNLDGTVDTSFGNNGVLITPIVGILDLNFQQGNKLIVSGSIDHSTGNISLFRYLSDGTLDNTFATNGVLATDLPNGNLYKINLFDDDSFLLTGSYNANNIFFIVFQKYLNNGTLDTSFGNNGRIINQIGSPDSFIDEVKIHSNSIYVLAPKQSYNDFVISVLKFTEDYILDDNFGTNGIATTSIDIIPGNSQKSIAFDLFDDGSIYLAGGHGNCDDFYMAFHAKLKPDGEKDTSFGNYGVQVLSSNYYMPEQVIIQENNRVLIAGNVSECFEWSFATISRYFSDGFEDASFNLQDDGQEVFFDDMQILADGKIIMVGTTPWYNGNFGSDFAIVRYNNNTLSISEFENQKTTIYPNPSNGIFTIERELFSENTPFQITDITGKIIVLGELTEKQTQLNLSSAQSGVYFLKTSNSVFRLLKN
ncbi:T9SS type A sorting domain-containing protein [Aequorivita viscosa]|nr:T9SS type A sorting domain-containing protein [Aequorivita viscosa]